MHCPTCYHHNVDKTGKEIPGLRFCMKCGEEIKLCSGCGASIIDLDNPKFCPFCGATIHEAVPATDQGSEYDPTPGELEEILRHYEDWELRKFARTELGLPKGTNLRDIRSDEKYNIRRLFTLTEEQMVSSDGLYGVGRKNARILIAARRTFVKQWREEHPPQQ